MSSKIICLWKNPGNFAKLLLNTQFSSQNHCNGHEQHWKYFLNLLVSSQQHKSLTDILMWWFINTLNYLQCFPCDTVTANGKNPWMSIKGEANRKKKKKIERQYKFPWGCKSVKSLGTDWDKKDSCLRFVMFLSRTRTTNMPAAEWATCASWPSS